MTRKIFVLSICTASILAWVCLRNTVSHSEGHDASAPLDSATSPVCDGFYHWTQGTRASGRVSYSLGPPEGGGLSLASDLGMVVLRTSADEVWLGMGLRNSRVVCNGAEIIELSHLADQLSLIHIIAPDGAVIRDLWSPGLAEDDRQIFRPVFTTEFVLRPAARDWTTEEKFTLDHQGAQDRESALSLPILCTYHRNGKSIMKSRGLDCGQLQINASSAIGVPGRVWLASLSFTETLVTPFTRLTVSLHYQQGADSSVLNADDFAGYSATKGLSGGIYTAWVEAKEKKRWEVPLPSITAGILSAAQHGLDMKSVEPHLLDLRDWLRSSEARTNKPGAEELLAEIRSLALNPKNNNATAVLVHALELAGTPACHNAITSLLVDSSSPAAIRVQAAAAAGGLGASTQPAVVEALWQMASMPGGDGPFAFAKTAGYALGTLARAGAASLSELRGAYEPLLGSANPDDAAFAARVFANAADGGVRTQIQDLAKRHPSLQKEHLDYLIQLPADASSMATAKEAMASSDDAIRLKAVEFFSHSLPNADLAAESEAALRRIAAADKATTVAGAAKAILEQ